MRSRSWVRPSSGASVTRCRTAHAITVGWTQLLKTSLFCLVAGCSFSQMCQIMEREGVLQLKRKGEFTWEVASSKLQQQVRPRRSPPPAATTQPRAAAAGDRWIMN